MGLRSPFGVHGFIPGVATSLLLFLVVSALTRKLPADHLARVWGEKG